MKLTLITKPEILEQNAKQWDAVAGDFPFFRFAWMGNWIKHLGKDSELAVLVAIDDEDQWVGIAPYCVVYSRTRSKRLKYISSGVACSDYLSLFTKPGYESEFSSAVVDWVIDNIGADGPFGRIDSIELEGITLTDPDTQYLVEQLSSAGLGTHTVELEGCWKTDLPSNWSDFEIQCSKSMRRKTKKATKRLTDDQTEIRSTRNTSFKELWSTFVYLHQVRRQMLEQSGCFADPNFAAFLENATRELTESGHAEIVQIDHQGTPLASMLLLNDGETVYMYQSGSCNKRAALEPGYQMAAYAIQRSIDQGFKAFDFLRGDEPYKARWNTTRVPLSRVKFIPRSITAQLKHSLWLTGRSFKEQVNAPK